MKEQFNSTSNEYASGLTPDQVEAIGKDPNDPLLPLHDAIVNSDPFMSEFDQKRIQKREPSSPRLNKSGKIIPMGVIEAPESDARKSIA